MKTSKLEEAMTHAIDVDGMVRHLEIHERELAQPGADRKEAFVHLITLPEQRYLFLSRGSVPIVDGRHFFAAMYQELSGEMLNKSVGLDIRGFTLLLGVGNEVAQCAQEGLARQLNSCFSPEDLGTNRMGYTFARKVIHARSRGTTVNTPQMLRAFFEPFGPCSLAEVYQAKGPGVVNNAMELGRVYLEFTARVIETLWPFIVPASRYR